METTLLGAARVRVHADFSSFEKDARKGIGSKLAGVGAAVTAQVAKGVAAAGGIGGALFGAKALSSGFKRLNTIEDATKSLTTILGDSAKAGDLLAGVLDTVRGTPFSLEQFATAGKNLAAFGVDAGKVPGYLEAIGEAAAASGKGAEGVDRVVDAFGKIAAQGKVQLDNVWSISDTGVPALQILANAFGTTTEDMQKLISAGAVPAEKALDALTAGIVKGSDGAAGATVAFGGSMEGLRSTMTGALGGLGSAISRYGAAVIEPFAPTIKNALTGAADTVDAVGAKAGEAAQKLVDSGALDRLAEWVGRVPGYMDTARDAAGRFLDYARPALEAAADQALRLGRFLHDDGLPALQAFGGFLRDTALPALGRLVAYVRENREYMVALGAALAASATAFAVITAGIKVYRGVVLAATAVQMALNGALLANPVGIVVLAIGALVGALVLAYQKSETFRRVVDAAWAAIRIGAGVAWAFMRDKVFIPLGLKIAEAWKTFQLLRTNLDVVWAAIKQTVRNSVADVVDRFMGMVGTVIEGAASAFSWVPGLGDKLATAADDFNTFRDSVNRSIRGIDAERNIAIRAELDATAAALVKAGADPAAAAHRVRQIGTGDGVIRRALGGAVFGPGTGTSDSVPAMLSHGEHVWTAKEVAKAGGHHAVEALRRDVLYRANGGAIERRGVTVTTKLPPTDDFDVLAGRLNAGAGALADSMRSHVKGLEKAANSAAATMADPGGPLPAISAAGWMRPGRGGRITSEFGMRRHPLTGRTKLHNGIDVAGLAGSRVLAMQAGRVSKAARVGSYGNFLEITHGGGLGKTGYAHLARFAARVGQQVARGQLIGYEGSTGGVTGKHLHQNWNRGGQWVNPRRMGVYDHGGLAKGLGYLPKATLAPERVLSPRQTAAFETALDGDFGGGKPSIEVHNRVFLGDREVTDILRTEAEVIVHRELAATARADSHHVSWGH